MKKIVLKVLIVFICLYTSSIYANETYTKENITKHLEVLFTKNIRYEQINKNKRYLPFSHTINLYYEFSSSIKNQKEKVKILKSVAKKFERIIHLPIKVKHGKPDITLTEQNGMLKTIYNTEDSLFEENIYIDFATKNEILLKLKKGFWYKRFFFGAKSNKYQRYINYIDKQRYISLGIVSVQKIQFNSIDGEVRLAQENILKKIPTSIQIDSKRLKNYFLLEVSNNRNKYFEKFIIKEIYLSLFPYSTRLNTSKYIVPSVINKQEYSYKKDEVSKFDWIVLDEFYNNKNLKDFMFYKTEVIPILTEAIYKRLQGIDDE